jgi:hypothetical protein
VDVLKLHGSLNWALTFPGEGDGGNRIEPLSMAEFLNIAPAAWKNIGQHRCDIVSRLSEFFLNYKRKRVMPTPVIVPPTWNKADYHSALSSVWAAAADHLAQAEHVIVIGYSLPETDAFFRHLWALGSVGEHPLQSFFVLNKAPKGGSVDRRFKRLLGHDALARYQYIHGEFNEFAVGTIRQYLQKDVTREKMIENFRMAEPPR